MGVLQGALSAFPTTEEEDLLLLANLPTEEHPSPFDVDWKLTCSLHYRLTRKRIASKNIRALTLLIGWIQDWAAEGVIYMPCIMVVWFLFVYDCCVRGDPKA